jgi:hypothetical protein
MPQPTVRLSNPEEERRRRLRFVRRLECTQRLTRISRAERLDPGFEELMRIGCEGPRGNQQCQDEADGFEHNKDAMRSHRSPSIRGNPEVWIRRLGQAQWLGLFKVRSVCIG